MQAVIGPDELRGDPHTVAGFAHRAFDKVRCPERLTDGAQILVLALEFESRGAPDDLQVRNLGQRRGDLLGHAVREELLAPVADRFTNGSTAMEIPPGLAAL